MELVRKGKSVVTLLLVRFAKYLKNFGNITNLNLHLKRLHPTVINSFQPVNNSGNQFSSPVISVQKELIEQASASKEKCHEHLLKRQRQLRNLTMKWS